MLEALNYECGGSEVRRTSNIVPTGEDKQKWSQMLSSKNVHAWNLHLSYRRHSSIDVMSRLIQV